VFELLEAAAIMIIVPQSRNPVIELLRNDRRQSSGARGFAKVSVPQERLRATFDRIEQEGSFKAFVDHIPMVRDLRRERDRFVIELQFKVSILSVRFGATQRLVRESPDAVRFDYIEGEPRGLSLRFAGHPLEGAESLLQVDVGYDIDSLGWLAKHFLKHHPEIRDGAHAGTAVAIVEALRAGVEHAKT
jgi:hypothetical protein